MTYSIEIVKKQPNRVVASRIVSSDTTESQRLIIAKELINKYSDPRDCYVVEYDLTDGSVLDIYDVV